MAFADHNVATRVHVLSFTEKVDKNIFENHGSVATQILNSILFGTSWSLLRYYSPFSFIDALHICHGFCECHHSLRSPSLESPHRAPPLRLRQCYPTGTQHLSLCRGPRHSSSAPSEYPPPSSPQSHWSAPLLGPFSCSWPGSSDYPSLIHTGCICHGSSP